VTDAVSTRRASSEDFPAILELAREALGWSDADASFLEWKHRANAFGESPMWVAEADGRIVGFRAFLRWELTAPDGTPLRAVRAVDTATDPAYQGRGIFTRLTLDALEEMRAEGVVLVFNTPNTKSLPGYLKMGWHQVGRLPVVVRPNRWRFPLVLATARRAAERAAVATDVGAPASVALGPVHADEIAPVLARVPRTGGLRTRHTPASLAWRFGDPGLGYRLVHDGALERGFAVFRLRRRGSAVEAVVCEVVVPGGERAVAEALLRLVAASDADYLIRLGSDGVTARGFVRLPHMGPVLVSRPLGAEGEWSVPALPGWSLTMGDVELL
jgi:GNAT superfamily N-acetyltransferase